MISIILSKIDFDLYSNQKQILRNVFYIQNLKLVEYWIKLTGSSSLDNMWPTWVCCITCTILIKAGNALQPAYALNNLKRVKVCLKNHPTKIFRENFLVKIPHIFLYLNLPNNLMLRRFLLPDHYYRKLVPIRPRSRIQIIWDEVTVLVNQVFSKILIKALIK